MRDALTALVERVGEVISGMRELHSVWDYTGDHISQRTNGDIRLALVDRWADELTAALRRAGPVEAACAVCGNEVRLADGTFNCECPAPAPLPAPQEDK